MQTHILIINNAEGPLSYKELEIYGKVSYLHWKKIPESNFYPVLSNITHILITGGSQHIYEFDKTPEMYAELDLLREAIKKKISILGICLGFQILNHLFGNTVIRLLAPCIGHDYMDTSAFPQQPLLHHAFSFHYDGVIENTNPDLQVLARSKEGIIYCIQHKTLPIFGIQSHPDAMREDILGCCKKYEIDTSVCIYENNILEKMFYDFFDFFIGTVN